MVAVQASKLPREGEQRRGSSLPQSQVFGEFAVIFTANTKREATR